MANNYNNQTSDEQKKKKKLVLLLLVFLLAALIATGIVLGVTLSRYKNDDDTGSGSLPVAKWGVTTDVNGTLTVVDNANVVAGKIAPASEAYIDVVIELKGTEVAVDYEITIGNITASTGNAPAGLKIDKVVKVEGGVEGAALTDDDDDGKYVGTIDLPENEDNEKVAFASDAKFTARIYFVWENDEANNTADTAIGAAAPTLSISFTVGVQQHID